MSPVRHPSEAQVMSGRCVEHPSLDRDRARRVGPPPDRRAPWFGALPGWSAYVASEDRATSWGPAFAAATEAREA